MPKPGLLWRVCIQGRWGQITPPTQILWRTYETFQTWHHWQRSTWRWSLLSMNARSLFSSSWWIKYFRMCLYIVLTVLRCLSSLIKLTLEHELPTSFHTQACLSQSIPWSLGMGCPASPVIVWEANRKQPQVKTSCLWGPVESELFPTGVNNIYPIILCLL